MIDWRTKAGNKQDKPGTSCHSWKQGRSRRLLGSYENEIGANFEWVSIHQRWGNLNTKNNNYSRLKYIRYIEKSVFNDSVLKM